MIYSLSGKLMAKKLSFVVIETGGVGYKIFVSLKTYGALPKIGSRVKIFSYFHMREDAIELYGFLSEEDLKFFELLNSISGVGPRSAIKILGSESASALASAIQNGRIDLLAKVSGIGRKTAERIVLELRDKVKRVVNKGVISLMEHDQEIEEALRGLGYEKEGIREVIKKIPPQMKKVEERLRFALKSLSKR